MFLKITIVLFLLALESSAQPIRDYEAFVAVCTSNPDRSTFIALRRFYLGNAFHYLLVNPADLSTQISSAAEVECAASSWNQIRKLYADSSYFRAIRDAEQNSDLLQDAGITRFLPVQHGVDLTIDLCPSKRPLDRTVFVELIKEFYKVESPVPIAISVTGLWMQEHREDFQWLLELVRSGQISVEWINHTFNHRTSRTLPLKENFLLEKGTDLPFEILQTEVKMIENGIKPSIFFRFPGLVSDRQLFRAITAYGLIPVGSDAWLAKNQWPKPGSIILIHANGNEPIGIKDFLQLLKKERKNVLSKHWLLYDLRESVEEEDKHPLNPIQKESVETGEANSSNLQSHVRLLKAEHIAPLELASQSFQSQQDHKPGLLIPEKQSMVSEACLQAEIQPVFGLIPLTIRDLFRCKVAGPVAYPGKIRS